MIADIKQRRIGTRLADLERTPTETADENDHGTPSERGKQSSPPDDAMTDNQLERLREIAELLTTASSDVDRMLWYAERGAESRGFQWLMGSARLTTEAQRRLKTFLDEQADGWRMLDSPKFDVECPIHNTYRHDERCPNCTARAVKFHRYEAPWRFIDG